MRPVDDGAPTSPVTLGAVGLGGTSLTVHWTVPAGLDDYADVTLHRTDVTAATPTVDVPHAAGTRFTFSNLVLGHDYTFTATVYDGSGHAGPDSNLVTATAAGAKVVSVSPTSSAQRSLPFHVTWGLPGQPTQTNPVTYDVSYAVKSGSTWTLGSATHWYTGTSLTGATFTKGVAGQTYYFLATVHDTHGNAGSTAWTGVNVPLDQKAASFSSGWKTLSSTNYWLGTLAYTPVSRAAATFVVTAKGVSVIATKCTTCGWVAIYIDGHKVTAVSTKSSTTRYRQVVWTGSFRSIGKHTVKLVASLGSGQHLGIDGLADPR
jgi:hypothetical protein